MVRTMRQVAKAVAALAGFRSGTETEDAADALDNAYQELLGLDARMLRLLAPNIVAQMAFDKGVIEPLVRVIQAEREWLLKHVRTSDAASLEKILAALYRQAEGRHSI